MLLERLEYDNWLLGSYLYQLKDAWYTARRQIEIDKKDESSFVHTETKHLWDRKW